MAAQEGPVGGLFDAEQFVADSWPATDAFEEISEGRSAHVAS